MTGCFQGIWAGGGPTNLCSAAEKKTFWDGANQSVYDARVANGKPSHTITPGIQAALGRSRVDRPLLEIRAVFAEETSDCSFR